jgi:RNA polymerase sigma factor (sigma-70 family)
MEEDIQLINKVKYNGDEESLKELINKHSGIYVDMVNKYLPESIEGVSKDDILEDKNFCIYDAAINYNENKKAKFSTYVGNLARWKCLNIYNKNTKYPKICINDNVENNSAYDSDINFVEQQENIQRVYSIINDLDDERVKTIFNMRYSGRRKLTPWKKIAKKLGLSIQGCINIHNKHLQEIKRYV